MAHDSKKDHIFPKTHEVGLRYTSAQRESRTGGSNITLEGIAILLTLTFLVRVIADIISRVRNGRSLRRSADDEVDILSHRVMTALSTVEQVLGQALLDHPA
ncbi:hypothetical protein Hamer_G007744 [Homarus americanus]|uniref:Uncharacterized protein n=1 Tax=Homarus americanus TaxID=6706 RepID=A0A8J5MR67_HOMAM|nr:hypothetical protein Hamer_G007744 [Homarus americanus]